jgi:hypothetical protein
MWAISFLAHEYYLMRILICCWFDLLAAEIFVPLHNFASDVRRALEREAVKRKAVLQQQQRRPSSVPAGSGGHAVAPVGGATAKFPSNAPSAASHGPTLPPSSSAVVEFVSDHGGSDEADAVSQLYRTIVMASTEGGGSGSGGAAAVLEAMRRRRTEKVCVLLSGLSC